MAKEKVVLAYSGGLDTSIIVSWLIENYGYEVICVCGDVGQGKETDGLEERAKRAGSRFPPGLRQSARCFPCCGRGIGCWCPTICTAALTG